MRRVAVVLQDIETGVSGHRIRACRVTGNVAGPGRVGDVEVQTRHYCGAVLLDGAVVMDRNRRPRI
jgi:hypothetical protein